ncbi:MAG: NADH-quinone oxidoreductase subunit J [Ignavibacteria bacterium]
MEFTFENILILVFSAGAVISAVIMVTRRNPVNSALFLIANFFCISVLYLFLKAQFIAIIQVIVYAGAIMVLFLFVIMLLNLQDESRLTENITYKKLTAVLLSLLLFSVLSITTYFGFIGKYHTMNQNAEQLGTVESVGRELYTTFSFPFELVSFILLTAIVGAIVLAKKKFE